MIHRYFSSAPSRISSTILKKLGFIVQIRGYPFLDQSKRIMSSNPYLFPKGYGNGGEDNNISESRGY